MKDSKSSIQKMNRYFKISPKSDNTVSTGKLANQVTSFEVNSPCVYHLSQYVTHFCENCEYKPLCGLCLQEGGHRDHSVKNVEKTSKIVHRVLTETLIRIRAKVNLLEVLGQHIQLRQTQIRNELKDYIINLNQSFDSLQNSIEESKKKTISIIESFYKIQYQNLYQAERSAKQQNDKLNKMINVLSQQAQKLDQNSICIFYYQKKDILQGIVQQGNSIYEDIKRLVPQLKWSLNQDIFEQFKNQINSISAIFDENHIQIISNSFDLKRKQQRKQKQKSLFKQRKSEKFINFNSTGFWTPKNVDTSKFSRKITKDMKDSKKILTLLSSESAQKANIKSIETPSMLLKKGKNKIKFVKNN